MVELSLTDLSQTAKWRVFDGYHLAPGTARGAGNTLVWSVTPGEWTVLGERPDDDAVDLTHVRAMFRLTGIRAAIVINRVCGLDLSDDMFPSGSAARTLFAGVATEIVRDDPDEVPSFLILPSRSFSTYVRDVVEDAGAELGLSV